MIHSLLVKIGAGLVALGMSLGFTPTTIQNQSTQTFGSFTPVGATQFTLAGAGINSTQTTIPLSSFTTPDGRPLTMAMFGSIGYGALEPQTTAKLEDITFNGITQNSNGTATLTGVTRGNDFVTPYLPSSNLAYSHAGGATFILTNTAGFYGGQFAFLNNNQTFSGNINFTGQTTFTNFPISPSISTSTVNLPGISQLATPAQQAGGIATSTNGTNAPLVLASQYATSTYVSKNQTANMVPVLNSFGHLDPGFVASSTQFSVTGTTTLSATSSVSIGAFPAWDIGKQEAIFTNTGTSTFIVPSGISEVSVEVVGGGGGSNNASGSGSPGAGGGGYSTKIVNVSATTSIQLFVGTGGITGQGQWSTFGTNGFYLYATGGTSNEVAGCGFNGDINSCGTPGGVQVSTGAIGGSSFLGGGGTPSTSGQNYGGGGGGPSNSNSGNTGASGIVIVRW